MADGCWGPPRRQRGQGGIAAAGGTASVRSPFVAFQQKAAVQPRSQGEVDGVPQGNSAPGADRDLEQAQDISDSSLEKTAAAAYPEPAVVPEGTSSDPAQQWGFSGSQSKNVSCGMGMACNDGQRCCYAGGAPVGCCLMRETCMADGCWGPPRRQRGQGIAAAGGTASVVSPFVAFQQKAAVQPRSQGEEADVAQPGGEFSEASDADGAEKTAYPAGTFPEENCLRGVQSKQAKQAKQTKFLAQKMAARMKFLAQKTGAGSAPAPAPAGSAPAGSPGDHVCEVDRFGDAWTCPWLEECCGPEGERGWCCPAGKRCHHRTARRSDDVCV